MILPAQPRIGIRSWTPDQLVDIKSMWDDLFRSIAVNVALAAITDPIDTHANRLALPAYDPTTLALATPFSETDRSTIYQVQTVSGANTWVQIGGVMVGLLASRPSDLGLNDTGFRFTASDTAQHFRWTGTVWVEEYEISNALTAAASSILNLIHRSSGAPAAGFGTALAYQLESSTNVLRTAGLVELDWSTATNAAESADFLVRLMAGGAAAAEKFRVTSLGDSIVQRRMLLINGTASLTAPSTALQIGAGSANSVGLITMGGDTVAGPSVIRKYVIGIQDSGGVFQFFPAGSTTNGFQVGIDVDLHSDPVVRMAPIDALGNLVFNAANAKFFVFSPSDGAVTDSKIQFGRRYSDNNALIGTGVECWPRSGQGIPTFACMAPGGGSYVFQVDVLGNCGIGVTPTAALHLRAGTATALTAPQKFTAGVNLTAPEAGAVEWDGVREYLTQTTGPTRQTVAYVSDIRVQTVTLTNQAAAIGSTNFTGVVAPGFYRLNYYLEDTTADVAAGTIQLSVAFTDDIGATTRTSAAVVLTGIGSGVRDSGVFIIRLASGNSAYSTILSGIIGASKYALFMTLEPLA